MMLRKNLSLDVYFAFLVTYCSFLASAHLTTLILFSHLAQTQDYATPFIIIILLHCISVCSYSRPSFPLRKYTFELTLCSNITQSWATVKVWRKRAAVQHLHPGFSLGLALRSYSNYQYSCRTLFKGCGVVFILWEATGQKARFVNICRPPNHINHRVSELWNVVLKGKWIKIDEFESKPLISKFELLQALGERILP